MAIQQPPSTPSHSVPLRNRPAWKALEEHCAKVRNLSLRQLFAEDPERSERFTLQALGLYFDYSKNRITSETIRLLLELAEQSGLRQHIDAMFAGEKINVTEQRSVLHVALRAPKGQQIFSDGVDVVPEVHAVLDKMAVFVATNSQRRVEGAYRQAHPKCSQHWHRRLGPRARDGLRGAEDTTANAT